MSSGEVRLRTTQGEKPVLGTQYEHSKFVPGGNKLQRASCCRKMWMVLVLITILLVVAVLAYMYKNADNYGINTPLKTSKAVNSSWEDDTRLWGSYRPNVYFGMRPRIPRSLLSGMMWYVYGHSPKIRHTCEDNELQRFGWLRHDGVSCGEQKIIDNGVTLKTEFVTTTHGWTARIRANSRDSSSTLVSFFFYIYNEGFGTMSFTSTEKSKMIMYGRTPELKKFQMLFKERAVSNDAVYNHTAFTLKSVSGITNLVERIAKSDFPMGRKKWPKIMQLPGDINNLNDPEFKPNIVLYQITTFLPFDIGLIFKAGGAHSKGADSFGHMFNTRMTQFDQKFEKVFHLKSKGYNESEVSFAKAALSNLLGSISYFYGRSIVKSKDSSDVSMKYWPAPLYTAIPSRTSFPRGFLWNEGFHQLLVAHWDTSIVKDVVSHWLDLMNIDGWIPREVILGVEASSKASAAFIVQMNDHANPPSFFLTLDKLIDIERESWPDIEFLRRIFPRLKKWFEWYYTTQAGEKEYTYRWRGRNETTELELIPVTMASGLNDFPRASHPTSQEYHLDLRCWMTLASRVMTRIDQLLNKDSQFYSARYQVLSDESLLDSLHWDNKTQTYSDYGLHTSDVELLYKVDEDDDSDTYEKRFVWSLPTLRFVDSFGYVNLFPFFFKLVSPTSKHLEFMLSKIADENILWTDYGLRSLSKRDVFYDEYNTKDDPPYWRGAIWINMNYLACRALHHYGEVNGPYRLKAKRLYNLLRSNLVRNMYKEYIERGYIWERYNDKTGHGQGTHPFTGWSSLIVLIMAEKY